MSRLTISMAVLALALAGGCKKKDGGNAGAGDQKAAEKAAEKPKAACAAGAITNPAGPYCIVLPAEWVARDPRDVAGDKLYDYNKNDNTYGVSVTVAPWQREPSSFAMELDMQGKNLASNKNMQSGDLPGGNGKYWSYEDGDGLWSKSIALSSTKMRVECSTHQSQASTEPAKQALLDACKTIVVQ